MIVVTGGLGFIGQNLVKKLQEQGHLGVVVLDTRNESLDSIYAWLLLRVHEIDCIYHFGAITDTTIMDRNKFDEYNVGASIFIWNLCTEYQIPLVCASSAATYGDGEMGFDDEKDIIGLKPLNPYGWSKQEFDVWARTQEKQPPNWYALKFFNVYGYGEAHKGKMASTIFHFYNQATIYNQVKLFKSHRSDYKDGEQKRDFIYVDDVVEACLFFQGYKPNSGIYNIGTGKARTFNDIAKIVFMCLEKSEKITYVNIPAIIRDKYQYFTEAKIDKLRNAGYNKPFHELEEGILKYINNLKNEIG